MRTFPATCLIAFAVSLFSCNPSSTRQNNTANDRETHAGSIHGHTEQNAQDSLLTLLGAQSGRAQVIAGESVGILKLKAPSDTLFALLGKADSTAADMCKDLAAWQPAQARLRVYSLCDNDLDMRKSMQVIGLSRAPFSTQTGLNEKSTLAEIRQAYPGLEIVGSASSGGEMLFIADDMQQGIAFEFSDTSANAPPLAVLVHLPGKAITATTIPLYPDLVKTMAQ